MLNRLIPSMYHRRLLLLATGGMVVIAALLLQVTRLTLVQGDIWRERAERVLSTHTLVRTARGTIYDRNGYVLAEDQPSYDVAVKFDVISGKWVQTQARAHAKRTNPSIWSQVTNSRRDALQAAHVETYQKQLDQLWSDLASIGGEELQILIKRCDSIVKRVDKIAQSHWKRQLRNAAKRQGVPVEQAEYSRRPVREHLIAHSLLNDADAFVRRQIRHRIVEATALAKQLKSGKVKYDDPRLIWRHVSLSSSHARVYPSETMTVEVDVSTFPPPVIEYLRSQRSLSLNTAHNHSDYDCGECEEGTSVALLSRAVVVEGVAWQMIGQMRDVWGDELNARPFSHDDLGGYLPGDRAGRRGVESTYESLLRGYRGRLIQYVDGSREDEPTDPKRGRDVTMSLDVHLQARIQAVMHPDLGLMRVHPWHAKELWEQSHPKFDESGNLIAPRKIDPYRPAIGDALNGAVVVLDIESGDVLAAVSTPTFSLKQMREDANAVWKNHIDRPYMNRAIGQPYRPGSTVKPLIYTAAVTDNLIGPTSPIDCNGMLDPKHRTMHRCWIFKSYGTTHNAVLGHGLSGRQAIARSCNLFFYTLGERFGAHRLVGWYDSFGLGHTLDCGLDGESAGVLPKLENASVPGAPGFSRGDAIMMGIGQGPVDWTVLQAANAYATLARSGSFIAPTLVKEEDRKLLSKQWTRRRDQLSLNPDAVSEALAGLHEVVTKRHGTAFRLALPAGKPEIFNVPGITLYGKSGTATATPLTVEVEKEIDGKLVTVKEIKRRGDHAWFIGLVKAKGASKPQFAVAVVVEFGGSGGTVAGPIANQVIRALKKAGYL